MELFPVSSEEMLVHKVHDTHPEVHSYLVKENKINKNKTKIYYFICNLTKSSAMFQMIYCRAGQGEHPVYIS